MRFLQNKLDFKIFFEIILQIRHGNAEFLIVIIKKECRKRLDERSATKITGLSG